MTQIRQCTLQDLEPKVRAEVQKFISAEERVLLRIEHLDRKFFGGYNYYNVNVVTDRQAITSWIAWGTDINVDSKPLDEIYSINQGREFDRYFVEVEREKIVFADQRELADLFAKVLKDAKNSVRTAHFPLVQKSSSKDIADQLIKLIDLRDKNLISQEEFDSAKRKLLE